MQYNAMTKLPESVWRLRKRKVIQIIAQNGGYREIGQAWGTSNVYANIQVRERWPHLAAEIRDRRFKNAYSAEVVYHRLQTVLESKTHRQAAKKLGITAPALHFFLKRHAPFGLEDAIDLYKP